MSWLTKWLGRDRRKQAARRSARQRHPPVAPRPRPAVNARQPQGRETWRTIIARFRPPPGTSNEQRLADAGNDMEKLFYSQPDRVLAKWHHYLEIYDRHLGRFRGTPVRLLEIGVQHGGSLQLWRRYFGPAAVIHGIDVDPECALIDDSDLTVHIGNQADAALLGRIEEAMGGIDVVIDDGSHVATDQIATFLALFPRMSDHGIYICEDLQTAYWRHFGGGLGVPGTFIEFLKTKIDGMHARYFEKADAAGEPHAPSGIYAISIYDSITVIEKRPDHAQFPVTMGTRQRGQAPGQAPA